MIDDINNIRRAGLSNKILEMFSGDLDKEPIQKAKRIEEVTVHKNNKTFKRKQLVGSSKEESVKESTKDKPSLASSKVKETDVDKLKKYVKYGTDEKMVAMAREELKKRGVKIREPQWYDEINQKYQIKTLPINVDKSKVTFANNDDPHSSWIMKWKDPKTGADKYSYSKEHDMRKSKVKFTRAVSLPDNFLSDVSDKASELMKDKDAKKQQAGMVLFIMSNTGLRVGDVKHLDKTGNEGVTTLSAKSVSVSGNTVNFDFIGKSTHRNVSSITDKQLATKMSLILKDKKPADMVFPDVSRTSVMDTFRDDFGYKHNVLKDIRTMVACTTAVNSLYGKNPPPPLPEDAKKARKLIADRLKDCFETVSNKLNNSPTMAKNSYINPIILNDWLVKVGGDDIIKAVHEAISIPTLKEISKRTTEYKLDKELSEDDYYDDDADDETYYMPEWMQKLFNEAGYLSDEDYY